MVQRSTPPRQLDERAFPIRLKLQNPLTGPGWIRWTDAEIWLRENVGAGQFAYHGQEGHLGHTMAFYFRTLDAARRFMEAFPDYRLADTTDTLEHLRNARGRRHAVALP